MRAECGATRGRRCSGSKPAARRWTNGAVTEDLLRRSPGTALFDRVAPAVLSRALPAPAAGAGLTLPEKVAIHVWTLDTSDRLWFARITKERPLGRDAFEEFVRNHKTLPEVYRPGFVGASADEHGRLRRRAVLVIESLTGRDISSLSSKPMTGV